MQPKAVMFPTDAKPLNRARAADASAHRQHPRSLYHRCRLSRPQRPPDHKFKVYTAGQKRRVTPQIKREFKRRAAIEGGVATPGGLVIS